QIHSRLTKFFCRLGCQCPGIQRNPAKRVAEGLSLMRDREWEEKEKSYHEHAIAELNTLVRRYNGIAPYAVRRGLHTREVELARCYETSGERILSELRAGQSQRTTSSSVYPQARTSMEETPNL
ncbi:4204_t:CDS:2, partial [Acaulospora colombiana]